MKGMKGKIIRKLKTIQAIGGLRQGLASQVNPSSNANSQKDIGLLCNKHYLKELNNESIDCSESNAISTPMKLNDTTKDHHDLGNEDHDQHDDHGVMIDSSSLLEDFEEKCPPGGKDKVILYTTSLRGIRKTFEDCCAVRVLLESYKVSFLERDVSLHKEFREELWEVLGEKVVPPKLFIKGRYVGGAKEVVEVLNEQGKLKKLLEGIPVVPFGSRCIGCANMRFSVCENCSGSRKVLREGGAGDSCYARCPECNENGLVKCSICCC